MSLHRRGFLFGLGAALAAPAIVPYASLMPVKLVDWGAVTVCHPIWTLGGFMYSDELSAMLRDDLRAYSGVRFVKAAA